jgi:hypothetical protein
MSDASEPARCSGQVLRLRNVPRRTPATLARVLVNSAGLPDTQVTTAHIIAAYGAVLLATVSSAAVGAVLASRRPRHPVGWLLLGVGLAVA